MSSPGTKRRKSRKNMIPFCCCSGEDSADPGQEEFQPPESRSCTDVVYLIIYVVFCFLMILIAAFAYVYGNPYRLINGMDSFGNVCGTSNDPFGNWSFSGMDMTTKPYVLYFDRENMDQSTKICVEQCPDKDLRSVADVHKYYRETGVNLCRYDYKFVGITRKENTSDDLFPRLKSNASINLSHILCPKFPFYSSLPILKRCIPKPSTQISGRLVFNIYAYLNSLNIWKQILGDLAVTWITVLGLTAVSFVISFIMVVLIHYITNLLSHLIMIAACALCLGLTGFLWWTYADLKSTLDNLPPERQLQESANNEAAFLTYSIFATIFTIILILVTMALRKRVAIVVQLFRESASALCAMPCLVIQPFITYFSLTGFFCIWLYVILCLATADIPTKKLQMFPTKTGLSIDSESEVSTTLSPLDLDEEGTNLTQMLKLMNPDNITVNLADISNVYFIEYRDGAWVKYMWWIYIIGLVWCSEFILACQQMVIASSVAAWYFSRKRSNLKCVIMESIVRLIKYHAGSVALGSAVITMVKIPRLMLAFTERVLRKWEDSWTWVKYAKKGCACCLACFENCIKYVHHNAYTVIAIQGVDFCPASRLAFSALVQNALQVAVINSTGDFVLFLAKCITAALTGLIALIIFRSNDSLYFYAIPVLLTVVFSYFVAHCVISVFEMAVDTLFLCFCEDHNMNDGTDGKEFYAPESLLKFMTEDAVDAVAPGRRPGYSSNDKNHKAPIELSAIPEESIPMNTSNNSPA